MRVLVDGALDRRHVRDDFGCGPNAGSRRLPPAIVGKRIDSFEKFVSRCLEMSQNGSDVFHEIRRVQSVKPPACSNAFAI